MFHIVALAVVLLLKKIVIIKYLVEGDKDHPVNKGMLCSKGMNLHYVANDTSDRILYPEMRWSRSHPRERVSWEDALDRTASVFKSIIKKYGPIVWDFMCQDKALLKNITLPISLTKGFLGTNNIDTNSRFV